MSQVNQSNLESGRSDTSKKYIVSWTIAIILLISCAYLLISRNRIVNANAAALKQMQQTIDSIKTDRVYLQADFDATSVRIDQLMSKTTRVTDSLRGSNVIIAALRTQIKGILANQKATREELLNARSMIYLLNDKAQAYELYIAELEKENSTLSGQNKLLKGERDNTVEKNIALHMAGSILHASNIRVELIHERRNGNEKETSKAKKVDKIRITFDIDENRIAESGTKQVYIRIIGPDSKILYAADVSGTMNSIEGDQLKYSVLKEIELVKNQPSKDVITDWLQNDSYQKGVYRIELYNMGHKIGEKSVALK